MLYLKGRIEKTITEDIVLYDFVNKNFNAYKYLFLKKISIIKTF